MNPQVNAHDRMWPAKGFSAARDSLLNWQNYKFWSLKDKKKIKYGQILH